MKGKKIIYVFDFLGEFIESLPMNEVAKKYVNGNYNMLARYVEKTGLYKKFYYFLETEDFIIKKKKAEPNPLLQKCLIYPKRGKEDIEEYTDEEKRQIINKTNSDVFFSEKYNVSAATIRNWRRKWTSSNK